MKLIYTDNDGVRHEADTNEVSVSGVAFRFPIRGLSGDDCSQLNTLVVNDRGIHFRAICPPGSSLEHAVSGSMETVVTEAKPYRDWDILNKHGERVGQCRTRSDKPVEIFDEKYPHLHGVQAVTAAGSSPIWGEPLWGPAVKPAALDRMTQISEGLRQVGYVTGAFELPEDAVGPTRDMPNLHPGVEFRAHANGDGWLPMGLVDGREVWVDGCCTTDATLASRIALNMKAAFLAGVGWAQNKVRNFNESLTTSAEIPNIKRIPRKP